MTLTTGKTLAQWLDWLENTRPESDIDLGLERIESVAVDMALLKPAPFIITVAGTNGKGSTVALLEAILLDAGYRVGVFTSPHFLRFNERVHINGQDVDDQSLCAAFTAIDETRGSTWLTYFEFATLAALFCFKQQSLDFVILEVGLGGRLDATNIVDHDLAVITSIGLDHQEWLGYSLEAIGGEKAGIIRREKPAIFGGKEMPRSIGKKSIELEAPLYRRGHEFDVEQTQGHWSWKGLSSTGQSVSLADLPYPCLELDNAVTALQVLQFLPETIERKFVDEGLNKAKLPGRMQRFQQKTEQGHDIEVVLDVSHNPPAVEKLVSRLKQNPVSGKTHVVLAMCNDKDHVSVIDLLASVVDRWVITAFDSVRAQPVKILAQALERLDLKHDAQVSESVTEAYKSVLAMAEPGDRVLVTGSFMTVAEVLALKES